MRALNVWNRVLFSTGAFLFVALLLACGGSTEKSGGASFSASELEKEGSTMPLRICRFEKEGRPRLALYLGEGIIELKELHEHYLQQGGEPLDATPDWENSLDFLPHGSQSQVARVLNGYYGKLEEVERESLSLRTNSVRLLPPLPLPAKFFLLAGNYAEHIQEGGGRAEEAAGTIPYVFWKPPSTTLRGSGAEISLPSLSPDSIDWEIELGVIIGRTAKGVSAEQALEYVAGYTVVNDISNRKFRPNPERTERPKDSFLIGFMASGLMVSPRLDPASFHLMTSPILSL